MVEHGGSPLRLLRCGPERSSPGACSGTRSRFMSSLITPGNLSHLHLLLNHFPTVGLTVAFVLLIVSILSDSDAMKHDSMKPTALGVPFGIAVITLPVFTTGVAAEGAIEKLPGISREAMRAHENAALLAFIVLELTGAVAWWGLWRWRGRARVRPGGPGGGFRLSTGFLGPCPG